MKRKIIARNTFLFLLFVLLFTFDLSSKTIYVDCNTPASPTYQTGGNWYLAFEYLQDALLVLESGDQIWIAEGAYRPDQSHFDPTIQQGNQNECFKFRNLTDVSIYGGFSPSNGITAFYQKDYEIYPVVIDGNDNSLILFQIGSSLDIDICGLSFMRSNYISQQQTATVLSESNINLVFTECIFEDNSSESTIFSDSDDIVFIGCDFINNSGNYTGGALFHGSEDISFDRCIFINNHGRGVKKKNTSTQPGAIAIYNPQNSVEIKNSIFYQNSSHNGGVLIIDFKNNSNVNAFILNSSFVDNSCTSTNQDAVLTFEGASICNIRNSVIYNDNTFSDEIGGSVIVNYSCIPNGYSGQGTNNIFSNPLLLQGDYHLSRVSPCINSGNSNYSGLGAYDIDGEVRVSGSSVDMGADESMDYSFEVIYVDSSNTGNEDGKSWATAFTELQDALDLAGPDNEIWVAKGTYYPSEEIRSLQDKNGVEIDMPRNNRSRAFEIGEGFSLYGGFNGTETSRKDRDWDLYPTILSGELSNSLDCYFLLRVMCINVPSIVDGFTIEKTDGTGLSSYCSAINMPVSNSLLYLKNCIVQDNINPGIHRIGGICGETGYLDVFNCKFYNNYDNAAWIAGGTNCTNNIQETVRFDRCAFIENGHFQSSLLGGGIYLGHGLKAEITNCIFSENLAGYGGALCCAGQSSGSLLPELDIYIKNCSFSNNDVLYQGQSLCLSNPMFVQVFNSILWSDGSHEEVYKGSGVDLIIQYSDVLGGFRGVGNIDEDPKFYAPQYHNLHLKSTQGRYHNNSWFQDVECSPCIDAGGVFNYSNEPVPNGNRINMGAYGNTIEASMTCSTITPKDSIDTDSTNNLILNRDNTVEVIVSPNPFSDKLKVKIHNVKQPIFEVSIYNLLGERVVKLYSGNLYNENIELFWNGRGDDMKSVKAGLYYIVVISGNERFVQKIISL